MSDVREFFSTDDLGLALPFKVDLELAPEPELVAPAPVVTPVALVSAGFLADALRELPPLDKASPNLLVTTEAQDFALALLALPVTDAGTCQMADNRIALGRQIKQRIEAEINPFIEQAHRLHAALCEKRRQWTAGLDEAIRMVGTRIVGVQRRLEAEAAAERRRRQDEADRQERERLAREAEAARAAGQTAVADAIREEAKVAVAAPVPTLAPPPLSRSVARTVWKARVQGCGCETSTSLCAEPATHDRARLALAKAVAEGSAPAECFELNWGYLNARARADKSTLKLPGIDIYEERTLAAKARR